MASRPEALQRIGRMNRGGFCVFHTSDVQDEKAKSSHQKSFREIARYQSLPRPAMLRAALLLLLGSPSVALLRPASHAALLRPTARPAVTMAGFGAPPAQGGKKVKKGGKSGAKSKSGGPPAKELLPKKQWTVYRELLKEDAPTAGVYAKDVEDEVRACLYIYIYIYMVCSGSGCCPFVSQTSDSLGEDCLRLVSLNLRHVVPRGCMCPYQGALSLTVHTRTRNTQHRRNKWDA